MKRFWTCLSVVVLLALVGVAFAAEAKGAKDGVLKIGCVSDIEGAIDNARLAAQSLQKQGVDMVIVAGDVYENEQRRKHPRYPDSTDNAQEMFDGLQPFAELGVPVYVIPGNHEERDVYRQGLAMLQQQYPQVIDVNGKAVDAGGAHLVGLGGYYLKNFIPDDGFLTNATSYAAAERQLKSFRAEAPVIFVTHSPPLGRSKIDLVEGVGHVGDANITRILSGTSVFHVCGHIHEGGGTFEQFNRSTSYNAASITPYMDPDAPRTTVFIVNKTIVPAGR